jgi:hypothetical protein
MFNLTLLYITITSASVAYLAVLVRRAGLV